MVKYRMYYCIVCIKPLRKRKHKLWNFHLRLLWTYVCECKGVAISTIKSLNYLCERHFLCVLVQKEEHVIIDFGKNYVKIEDN